MKYLLGVWFVNILEYFLSNGASKSPDVKGLIAPLISKSLTLASTRFSSAKGCHYLVLRMKLGYSMKTLPRPRDDVRVYARGLVCICHTDINIDKF